MGVVEMKPRGETCVPSALPTGIVTFLLTDIVGSAALWSGQGATVADAVARHYALIDEAVAAHGGVRPIEQGEGDSTVSAFARPSDAVRAAAAIQRAMRAESWPADVEVAVRIGVHTGEAMLRDERNYFGETITRAARIRDLASGGQTLLSNATVALVDGDLPGDISLLDVGFHELEGLSRSERLHQLFDGDLAADDVLGPAKPSGLPVQVSSFIGRHREIDELRDALRNSRVVTVVGTGGCGKTRLAIEAARGAGEVCWVDLSPLNDPSLIRPAIAAALGLRDTAGTDAALVAHLSGRALLLVLDNCEHLAAECAGVVDVLVRAGDGIRVLATSREALGVAGEHAWQLPSLSTDDAVALFVDRAAKVRPRFALTDDNSAAVTSICARLDGIPLAIELAAARARTLAPRQIAEGLADGFRLLTGGSRTALARQRTLEASVEWSHALLSDAERVVLRRLSVFAGGFTLDAAEAVCSGDGVEELAVLDLVTALADRSLVVVDDDGRFRLLETIRDYARHKLSDASEVIALRDRHLAFFLAMAVDAEPRLEAPAALDAADALEADHDNLRAAMEWSVESASTDTAFRLVAALPLFWLLRDHVAEGIDRVEAAVALEGGTPALRCRALLAGSFGGGRTAGPATRSRRLLAEGLELSRRIGDHRAEGRLMLWAGRDAQRTERATALPRLEQAMEIAEATGDAWCLAEAVSHLGIASFISGDVDRARTAFERAVTLTETSGEPVCRQRSLVFSALCEIFFGRIDRGLELLDEAMPMLQRAGDRYGITAALTGRAYGEIHRGDLREARRIAELAVAGARGSAYLDRLGTALWALAEVTMASGALADADAAVAEGLEISAAIGDQVGRVMLLSVMSRSTMLRGDLRRAEELVLEEIDAARDADYPAGQAEATILLGRIAARSGFLARGESLVHDALRVMVDRKMLRRLPDALESLGEVAAECASWVDATRMLAAAEAVRGREGLGRYPVEQPGFDRLVGSALEALGEEAFQRAWDEGSRLTLDETIEYVTRARRERGRPSHGWEALTPTELQVVRLVREGLTNPQIAARLFNSPGTVRAHMSHIFAKVGVSTRAELAAEATRRDI